MVLYPKEYYIPLCPSDSSFSNLVGKSISLCLGTKLRSRESSLIRSVLTVYLFYLVSPPYWEDYCVSLIPE